MRYTTTVTEIEPYRHPRGFIQINDHPDLNRLVVVDAGNQHNPENSVFRDELALYERITEIVSWTNWWVNVKYWRTGTNELIISLPMDGRTDNDAYDGSALTFLREWQRWFCVNRLVPFFSIPSEYVGGLTHQHFVQPDWGISYCGRPANIRLLFADHDDTRSPQARLWEQLRSQYGLDYLRYDWKDTPTLERVLVESESSKHKVSLLQFHPDLDQVAPSEIFLISAKDGELQVRAFRLAIREW